MGPLHTRIADKRVPRWLGCALLSFWLLLVPAQAGARFLPLYERAGLIPPPSGPAYQSALTRAEAQINYCQLALGEEHPATAAAQVTRALLLAHGGRHAEAQALLQGAMPRLVQHRDSAPGDLLDALLLREVLLRQEGHAEALTVATQAEAVRRGRELPYPGPVEPRLLLALLQMQAGAPHRAALTLAGLQRVARLPALVPRLEGEEEDTAPLDAAALRLAAAVHELMALCQLQLGKAEAAEATLRRVLMALEQQPADAADRAAVQSNLALLHQLRGRDAEAELLRRRLPVHAPAAPEDSAAPVDEARLAAAGQQALREAARGHRRAAEALLRQALGPLRAEAEIPSAARVAAQAQLGALLLDEAGQDGEAGRGAAARLEGQRRIGEALLGQARRTTWALLQPTPPPWLRAAQGLALRGLSGALVRGGSGPLAPAVAAALVRAADAEAIADELLAAAQRDVPGAAGLAPLWRQRGAGLLWGPALGLHARESLELRLLLGEREQQASGRLGDLLRRRDLSEAALQELLHRQQAQLLILLRTSSRRGEGAERYGALLLSGARGDAWLQDLGPAGPIDEALDRVLRAAQAQRPIYDDLNLLSAQLLKPLAGRLRSEAARLHAVVPPELAALPLPALLLPDGRPLAALAAVTMTSEVGELLSPPRPRAAAPAAPWRPALLLGAPLIFESPAGRGLRAGALELTPLELWALEHLMRDHRYDARGGPLHGLAATPARAQAWLPATVAHLLAPLYVGEDPGAQAEDERVAAQALLKGAQWPLAAVLREELGVSARAPAPRVQAGLLLVSSSRAQGRGVALYDDGLLSSERLAQMDLSGTSLLSLSLTTPAVSARTLGAALQELQRAARRAGARGVLLSLWRPAETSWRTLQALLDEHTPWPRLYEQWFLDGEKDGARALQRFQLEQHRRGVSPLLWAGLLFSGVPTGP